MKAKPCTAELGKAEPIQAARSDRSGSYPSTRVEAAGVCFGKDYGIFRASASVMGLQKKTPLGEKWISSSPTWDHPGKWTTRFGIEDAMDVS